MAHGVLNFCFVQFDKTVYNNDLIIDVKTFWRQFLLLFIITRLHWYRTRTRISVNPA